MVTSVTSFGRSGVYDWLVQRVTAVILLAYVLFVAGFVVNNADGLSYLEWRALFHQLWMRVFTLVALLALCAHAWIGMWTIGTDYLTKFALGAAAPAVRLVYNLFCLAVLVVYFAWCVQILWSA